MRRALGVLLPVSIFSFLLSYSYSCLPCYLHSITSLLHSLNHLTARKAMVLLAHAILLYLAKTSGLLGTASSVDTLSDVDVHDVDDRPFFAPLPADDGPVVHVDDRPFFAPLPADDGPVEVVEKRVLEESVVLRNYVHATESVEGCIECLAVAVVEKEGDIIVDACDMELVVVDELELLAVDELNRRFDEFIEREKNRRTMEALQLILV